VKMSFGIGWALVVMVTAAGSGGCSSTPATRYFALSSAPFPASAATAGLTPRATVASVHLPGATDRLQMVTRTGPNSYSVHEFDRWAEPLDQMVQRVLGEDLLAQQFASTAGQTAGPTGRISVDLTDFMVDADGSARATGTWKIRAEPGQSGVAVLHPFSFAVAAGSGRGNDAAAALSQSLIQLAASIMSAAA
jgi:uncharacterized lipoprotein YmbA